MRKNRSGMLVLSLVALLVIHLACCNALSVSDAEVIGENEKPVSLIKSGSDSEVYWKGEASYPYELTLHEWKESSEVEGERGLVTASFEVEYPSISGMKDLKLEQKINKLIYDDMIAMTEGFFGDSQYDTHNWRKCFVMLLTEDYLSIRYDGGVTIMRSNRFSQVLNIDLKSGRKLEVSDFFVAKAEAVELIMEYCKEDLKRQYEDYYKEPIGEFFSRNIDWSCTPKACSVVNLTQTGFYLIFDDVFSRAEGRWVVHAPYEAFGDDCKLRTFSGAYGFFSVPQGWSYSFNHRKHAVWSYIIKFPVIKDAEGRITNLTLLNDSEVMIELPLSLPDELAPGVKNPYSTTWMLIQRSHVRTPSREVLESEKEDLVLMDGRYFVPSHGYNVHRVLHPDASKNKIVQTWRFHEVNFLYTISFYIEYEFYSDLIRLHHQDALSAMRQQIFFQINEVLRTFQAK